MSDIFWDMPLVLSGLSCWEHSSFGSDIPSTGKKRAQGGVSCTPFIKSYCPCPWKKKGV